MNQNKKNKKYLKPILISFFTIIPLILSSCSSNTYIKRTIDLDTKNYLDTNTSLSSYVDYALNSESGANSYLSSITNQMVLNWLTKLSNGSVVEAKNAYNNQKTSIEDDYDDLEEKYQNDYGKYWKLKLQQEVFDLNGGTKESYLNSKWISWATNQFQNYLFNKNYLTYKNSNNEIVNSSDLNNTTISDLYTALSNQNFLFAYNSNNILDNYSSGSALNSSAIDNAYADFVNFIWNQYVQIYNPYVVNMVLWKYGTPSDGLSNYYLKANDTTTTETENDDGETESTTTNNSGEYIYPYFNNDTSSSVTTLNKYISFLQNASYDNIPYKANYDSNDYGLLTISNDYTDDSSTYILAKNTSIYNDLYTEFAAASSYLFWRNTNTSDSNFEFDANNSGIKNIDTDISKAIDTSFSVENNTTTGLDPITNEFVSTSSIFTNGDQYQIKLDNSYVAQIINDSGPLKSIANSDLYIVDSYIPSNNNLTNYIFLRNSAGVHAITIDGYYYINDTVINGNYTLSANEKKTRSGQVVLFRSLYDNLNAKEANYSFSVDIQSELQTFYEDNQEYLIYTYALNNPNNPLFDLSALDLEENEINLLTNINYFLHSIKYLDTVTEYNQTLIDAKSKYGLNYGTNITNNGLASNWIYANFSNNDSLTYDLNPYLSLQVSTTSSVTKNPYTNLSDTYNYDGSLYVSLSTLTSLITDLSNQITPLEEVDFEGFKYTQYLYTNNTYINNALLTFSSEGDNLTNLVKINYFKNYIEDVFDLTNLQFKNNVLFYNNLDLADYLNLGLTNFFYSDVYESSNSFWLKLSVSDNETWINLLTSNFSGTNNYETLSNLISDYFLKLWKQQNQSLTSNSIENYLSLYTLVASIKYLLNDNSSYYLSYMNSQIKAGDNLFVVWQNSQNTKLNTNSVTSASELLSANAIYQNLNNYYLNSYYGSYYWTSENDNNNLEITTITYQDELDKSVYSNLNSPNVLTNTNYLSNNDSTNYYHLNANMVGFLGLQTTNNNSVASVISEYLFETPTIENTNLSGVLYGYGNSLEEVINIINNTLTLSDINSIINNLADLLNQQQLKAIALDTSLSLKNKKTQIINALTNLSNSLNSTSIFNQRVGILNNDISSNTNDYGLLYEEKVVYLQYSSYVIQLNYNDFSSLNNLITALTTDQISTSNAISVFSNLVVQLATESDLQSKVISNLLILLGKINAYDVRLYTDLGVEWIIDWKVTNENESN